VSPERRIALEENTAAQRRVPPLPAEPAGTKLPSPQRNRAPPPVFLSAYIERNFGMGTILIVILLLLLLGAWPSWPYSRGWGYYPSGTLGLVLVIVLVLALLGRI
jgi:hypothetical protein